ncbi:MAG: hypothetical protein U1F87_13885 [Kiritimatiellia bacterium]
MNRLIKYRGIAGILLLVAALLLALAQVSYDPFDLDLYQNPRTIRPTISSACSAPGRRWSCSISGA